MKILAILACLVTWPQLGVGGTGFCHHAACDHSSVAPVLALGPLSASADLNQAAMSQIINQLNQRQFQLSVAAAQTARSTSDLRAANSHHKTRKIGLVNRQRA